MDISLRTDMKNQRQIISEKEAFRNIIEAIVQMGQFKISLNATMVFLSSLFGQKRPDEWCPQSPVANKRTYMNDKNVNGPHKINIIARWTP